MSNENKNRIEVEIYFLKELEDRIRERRQYLETQLRLEAHTKALNGLLKEKVNNA